MLGERKQPCASDHLDLESPRSNRNLSSVLGAITHFGPPAPNDTIHDSFFDIGRFDVYKPYLAGYQTSFPGGGSTSEIVLRYTLDDCAFLLDRLFERYKSIHGRASLDNHSPTFSPNGSWSLACGALSILSPSSLYRAVETAAGGLSR
jgi:hypothetical protein